MPYALARRVLVGPAMKPFFLALPLLSCVEDSVPESNATLYAAAVDVDLWKDGVVRYCLDEVGLSFFPLQNSTEAPLNTGGDPCVVRQALADLSVDGGIRTAACPNVSTSRGLTPLRFVESDCAILLAGTHEFIRYVGGVTASGKDTTSPHHARGFTIVLPSFSMRSVQHETGHAAGLIHEHQRKDRDTHITVNIGCRRTDPDSAIDAGFEKQFDVFPDAKLLTPYDAGSVMQYASFSFSRDEDTAPNTLVTCPTHPNSSNVNTCPSMLFKDDAPLGVQYCTDLGWRGGLYHDHQTLGLTSDDVNAFYQLYEQPLAAGCASEQQLGGTMAVGDFDLDGYDDLAVNAGHTVRLYKGTMNGLVAWRTLTETDFTGQPAIDDGFGSAMLASNGKLFIGTPGYAANRGAVFAYQPSASFAGVSNGQSSRPSTGPVPWTRIDAPAGQIHRFGSALAIGNFRVIREDSLAISSVDANGANGSVDIYVPSGDAFVPFKHIASPNLGTRDYFGSALASGDLAGVGLDQLAIGAKAATIQGSPNGVVYAYTVATTTLLSKVYEAGPAGTHDEFGTVVRIGRVMPDGGIGLVVGAPGAAAGRVVKFAWDGTHLSNQGMTVGIVPGDRFGEALRVGDIDGDNVADIVVGAPEAGVVGQVTLLRSTQGTLVLQAPLTTVFGFGAGLALGNFDGPGQTEGHANTTDLAVGAPNMSCGSNHANAGAFAYFRNTPGTHVLTAERQFSLTGPSTPTVIP